MFFQNQNLMILHPFSLIFIDPIDILRSAHSRPSFAPQVKGFFHAGVRRRFFMNLKLLVLDALGFAVVV